MLTLSMLQAREARAEELPPVPHNCPVTLPVEPRYQPTPPYEALEPGAPMFWYGSDALFTHIPSDGRWRGSKSPSGTRNKSFWYRSTPDWRTDRPQPELHVTAQRIDAEAAAVSLPRVTTAVMGTREESERWAMLLMLELPTRGCWEVTGNYKSDSLSFVVWVD
jgi:hypothetical protein